MSRSETTVRASARIDAPPERVYGIIGDYRDGHPHILPKQFRNLVVEAGGVGAGTIISFDVRAFGMTRRLRAAITEPQPGRVLVESNMDPDPSITTFTVDPVEGGQASDVTIETRLPNKPGILALIERAMSSRFLMSLLSRGAGASCSTSTARLKIRVRLVGRTNSLDVLAIDSVPASGAKAAEANLASDATYSVAGNRIVSVGTA